jgi:hypothetical protein
MKLFMAADLHDTTLVLGLIPLTLVKLAVLDCPAVRLE